MNKKAYIHPAMETVELKMSLAMLAGSGGVGNGSTPGNEYSDSDPSYSPGMDDILSF